jgi:hypothetical protein
MVRFMDLPPARFKQNVFDMPMHSMSFFRTVLKSTFRFREPASPLSNSIQPSLQTRTEVCRPTRIIQRLARVMLG